MTNNIGKLSDATLDNDHLTIASGSQVGGGQAVRFSRRPNDRGFVVSTGDREVLAVVEGNDLEALVIFLTSNEDFDEPDEWVYGDVVASDNGCGIYRRNKTHWIRFGPGIFKGSAAGSCRVLLESVAYSDAEVEEMIETGDYVVIRKQGKRLV